jgi:dTDP-4-amino-4,6-dideoxygalactose transaminase|tara:strand:- start:3443 stop:4048 length:606 start_codon:yes stop_codon:yes gene_type:complete
MNFDVVEVFEKSIARFYGAKYAVAVDCCTHAIELCLRYHKADNVSFPTRTYISIPFLGEKLGIEWHWDSKEWKDYYFIGNTNIVDAAVYWKESGYIPGTLMCLSFQFQKHLSLGRGGMILTDDKEEADELKKMSYDGRIPDKPWREQNISTMGYHYYMTPETALQGLNKIEEAIKKTPRKWEWEDWPDLRNMDIFKTQTAS